MTLDEAVTELRGTCDRLGLGPGEALPTVLAALAARGAVDAGDRDRDPDLPWSTRVLRERDARARRAPRRGEHVTIVPHLRFERSSRGLDYYPAVPSTYGGAVEVYTSSAASGPHAWVKITCPVDLNEPTGPTREVHAHLTAADAWHLGEQLLALVATHYHGDARPPASERVADVSNVALVELHGYDDDDDDDDDDELTHGPQKKDR